MTTALHLHYTDSLVQSPSSTQLWLRCPTLWSLGQTAGLHTPAIRTGRYVARCIARLRQGQPMPEPLDTQQARVQVAVSQALHALDTRYGPPLSTELPLGRARLDEVFMAPSPLDSSERIPLIIDYKYCPLLESSLMASMIYQHYAYSHQMLHYAWAYMQYTGSWLRQGNPHILIGICLLSEQPQPVHYVYTALVDKVYLSKWLEATIDIWWEMKTSKSLDKNVDQCFSPIYGQCPMLHHCWESHPAFSPVNTLSH